jgi:hypothetical protein
MSIATSQQLSLYYAQFANVDVIFTRDVLATIGVVSKQVFLKCLGYQWPCIIYSSSMTSAKVVLNVGPNTFDVIRKANNLTALRFCLKKSDKPDPIAFFVAARVVGFSPYNSASPDLNFVSLIFTQRPAEDLIESLGSLLEANINSKKRQEERIVMTVESMKKIGIKSKELMVFVQNIPRKAVLRDLSFSGVKVIIMGVAKFLLEKEVTIRFDLTEPDENILIPGIILRHEPVEGRKDLSAFVLKFKEDAVPTNFKMRINDYLRTVRKKVPADQPTA